MNSAKRERVMCMQHCSQEINIFFIDFPSNCPICGVKLENCQLVIPPFCLPCPLQSTSCTTLRCCVLIKQTTGDFLRDYKNGDSLHIGITDFTGAVYNYDERGLSVEKTNWEQCVVLDLSCTDNTAWDYVLHNSIKSDYWTSERYHEETYNCYDYVLSMLNEIHLQKGLDQDSTHSFTKDKFSRQFILPITRKLAKYIEMYRNIKSKGSVVLPMNDTS